MLDLSHLITEQQLPETKNMDQWSIPEILMAMNKEDQKVALAVQEQIPIITKVIETLIQKFKKGGKLYLCGAGTSGRLAIMEAAECPPTFSTPPELIQGIMAGAPESVFHAVEGAEDNREKGIEAAKEKHICENDMAIGISASGRTPYVLGFLEYAKQKNAITVFLCASTPKENFMDFLIQPQTGSEILTGSTRLKAATAAKMTLNMITTTSMIALGKVYGNWMVDLKPNSEKLIVRATNIISQITGCSKETAHQLLLEANNAKVAIIMYQKQCSKEQALQYMQEKSFLNI
ncbi:MAG TPA: N-acetylmuramic acid 6-phosphate etherase [Planctomycetota bacterium]|nr:N-acetylmuramic acid 6-phosphate etherase [Planctomycetota bacterium]